tara:strand:+ start:74 stop:2710 length:2637 start_codon:yes stop_codon:yes gene_type:complete
MATDITRTGKRGGDPQYDTSNITGVREERGIVTGIVKANVHGAHMGVIQVFIPTFSTNPADKSQWRTVRYCTPFYSRVDNQGPEDSYYSTKVSSGIVTPPPDLGTKVLAFFPEGRNAEGYYFACVPDTFMLQTVPEATLTVDGDPGGEFNDNPKGDKSSKKITNFKKQQRPVDFFTQNYLRQQGLLGDTVRGINNSGYMRESPSELIGISSKGRRIDGNGQDFLTANAAAVKNPDTASKDIVEGLLAPYARRKGHSITLDDGDIDGNSNQVRFRTSTGHQILLNDTEGVIYIGNSIGSAWIELSNNGTMDVYAQDSINFRSKNINFHADENMKFHSKGYTQIVSEQQLALEGKKELTVQSDGELGINGKKNLHLFTDSELFATSGGASYYNAGGNISVAGSLVLLQGPKTKAKQAKNISAGQKEDTTYDEAQNQFILDEEQMLTTSVDRLTMHEPFIGHGTTNTSTPFSGGLAGASGGPVGGYGIVPPALTSGIGPDIIQSVGVGNVGLPDELAFGGTGGALGSSVGSLIPSNIGSIVSKLPIDPSAFGGLSPDIGSFTKDFSGKITGMAGEMQAKLPGALSEFQNKLPGALSEFNKVLPQAQDQLSSILSSPQLSKFPITDIVKQTNTGFSIGALDSFDTQALNAAVVKQAGTLNSPSFIDNITKSVGKFGVNVDQLKKQGFVRPEAVFNDQLSDTNVWTGKGGASSLNRFLGNTGLQESVQQAIVAEDYQTLVNNGGIKLTDGKEQILAQLTASNNASPEIVAKVREGFTQIEGVLQNTTNIPAGADIISNVTNNMQAGAAAAKRAAGSRTVSDEVAALTRDTRLYGSAVSKNAVVTQSNANIAALHAQMFANPQAQKQLEQQILAIYAGVDNQGK